MIKVILRHLYFEKRASLNVSETASASAEIAERFFENIDLTNIARLHTFIRVPKFNEIDTSFIYNKLWRDRPDVVTVAPRTDLGTGAIENVAFDAETDWVENRWGIREPFGGEVVDPQRIDLVIVPLLSFAESGHRVGYGKGIYDRFLARCRTDCLKVGVSCFPPVAAIDDVSETDVRLDICITPDRVYKN